MHATQLVPPNAALSGFIRAVFYGVVAQPGQGDVTLPGLEREALGLALDAGRNAADAAGNSVKVLVSVRMCGRPGDAVIRDARGALPDSAVSTEADEDVRRPRQPAEFDGVARKFCWGVDSFSVF